MSRGSPPPAGWRGHPLERPTRPCNANNEVCEGKEGGDEADVKLEDDLINRSRDFPHI